MDTYFFALTFTSSIKWIQIISTEKHQNSAGLIMKEREPRFEMGCFAKKMKEKWSRSEHFQVDTLCNWLRFYPKQGRNVICWTSTMVEVHLYNRQKGRYYEIGDRKSELVLRSQITLLLFLIWKFHINYPDLNICATMCSYLTQHPHSFFPFNVCGRLAKGENRHLSLYKHTLTNISSFFYLFFFLPGTLFTQFYWSLTPPPVSC